MDNFIKLIENKLDFPDNKGVEFIQKEILVLFSLVEHSNNIDETKLVFSVLEDIQFLLAKAVFKNDLIVTPFLRKFVYDFDRIDDDDVKRYVYDKIKSKEYEDELG